MGRIDRRTLLWSGAAVALGGWIGAARGRDASRPEGPFRLSEAAWRRRLSPAAYAVLREAATERAYSSPLDGERRKGRYACAGCGQLLFSSANKYDSRTGWPSFWQPLPTAIGTGTDHDLGDPRTEVHCARCGGHLGHVFRDGPKPTGLRYCINGVALRFLPA
jgi:peptide-methionine (R)-S-oxide reductase